MEVVTKCGELSSFEVTSMERMLYIAFLGISFPSNGLFGRSLMLVC